MSNTLENIVIAMVFALMCGGAALAILTGHGLAVMIYIVILIAIVTRLYLVGEDAGEQP